MKTLLTTTAGSWRSCALLCSLALLATTAVAVERSGDELRSLIDEAAEAVDRAQAANRQTAGQLSAALEAKAALQVRADILAEQARHNADAALRSAEAYKRAIADYQEAHDDAFTWRWRCIGLAGLIVVYVGLRLHPATRAFIP